MRLKAVIFDLDGTLLDTIPDFVYGAFDHVLIDLTGRRYSRQEIASHFGWPERQILARLISEDRADEAVEKLYRYYIEHADRVRLCDGMGELLRDLKRMRVKLGLFTGRGRRGAEIPLQALGLADLFDAIVTGDDVAKPKPDPEGVNKLLCALGAQPDEALLVGDSPKDMRSGRAASVWTAAALWGAESREALLAEGPDLAFETVNELATYIKKCNHDEPEGNNPPYHHSVR